MINTESKFDLQTVYQLLSLKKGAQILDHEERPKTKKKSLNQNQSLRKVRAYIECAVRIHVSTHEQTRTWASQIANRTLELGSVEVYQLSSSFL